MMHDKFFNAKKNGRRGVMLIIIIGIFVTLIFFGYFVMEYSKGETNQLKVIVNREKLSYAARAASDLAAIQIAANYSKGVENAIYLPPLAVLLELLNARADISQKTISKMDDKNGGCGVIEVTAKAWSGAGECTVKTAVEFRLSPTRILPYNRFTLYVSKASSENFNIANKTSVPVVLRNGKEPLNGGIYLGGGQVVLNLPDSASYGLFHFSDIPDVKGFPSPNKAKGFILDLGGNTGQLLEFVYGHDTNIDNISDCVNTSRLSPAERVNLNRASALSLFGDSWAPSPTDLFFDDDKKEPPGILRSFIRTSFYYNKNSANPNIYLKFTNTHAQAAILKDDAKPAGLPAEISSNYKKFASGLVLEPYSAAKFNDYGKKHGAYEIKKEFKADLKALFKINADGTSMHVCYKADTMLDLISAGFLDAPNGKPALDLGGSVVMVENGPVDFSLNDLTVKNGGGILVVKNGDIIVKNVLKENVIDQLTLCALNGNISITGSKVVASLCAPSGQVFFNGSKVTVLGNLVAEKYNPKDKNSGGEIFFDPNLLYGGYKFNVR